MTKHERQQIVLEVLGRNRIDSQDQFVDLLAAEGVRMTQSTLSRDLRELGVVKSPSGYRIPEIDVRSPRAVRELGRRLRPLLRSVDVGGNIVVLRAAASVDANDVAERIESTAPHQVVRALAIGDTVLAIGRSAAYARDFARALR